MLFFLYWIISYIESYNKKGRMFMSYGLGWWLVVFIDVGWMRISDYILLIKNIKLNYNNYHKWVLT